MKKTKIDWADSTWNPVTGCLHGCEYCYARAIANRFGWHANEPDINERVLCEMPVAAGKKQPYPFDFAPTFHQYRLGEPAAWTKPRTIFVCSMADLFGDWVPDEWIKQVFQACDAAPQHRFLFLTKNPNRYNELAAKGMLPQKHWYGYTATSQKMLWTFHHADECLVKNLFVSIEPILAPIQPGFCSHVPADWVIVGAETGQRKSKVVPERKWIDDILMECEYSGRPIFMKESLRDLMGNDFRQEFPWGRNNMGEIIKCPHCGYEKPKVTEKRSGNLRRTGDMFQVICGRCKARGPVVTAKYDLEVSHNGQHRYTPANSVTREEAKAKAIELWNTRVRDYNENA